ncbi:MAG: hypothetical protein ACI8Z1_003488 [Candidatus Azotimanducaceae bacterium]|jgi:hypothetical protein
MHDLPYSLMSELQKHVDKGLPPVELWHPDVVRDIDLTIHRDGTWFYGGTRIKRPRMIKLFASVLRRDEDEYFLVTPGEKCRITVEDVPFQMILMEVAGIGKEQCLTLISDMADTIALDEAHPLRIERRDNEQGDDEWIPYVLVRGEMEGRLSRNVYYQLADLLVSEHQDGEPWLGVWSHGKFFPLMRGAEAQEEA